MKRKRLGLGLKPIDLGAPVDREAALQDAAQRVGERLRRTGKRVISIVRTKGGSGEQHVVKTILEKLLEAGDRVLVVFGSDPGRYEAYLGVPVVSGSQLASSAGNVALTKFSWGSLDICGEQAAELIDSPFDVVIFAWGLSGAPGFPGWKPLGFLSQMTIFSVNTEDTVQLEMSRALAGAIRRLDEDARWYGFWCWSHEVENGERLHQYAISETGDYLARFRGEARDLKLEHAEGETLEGLLALLQPSG